MESDVICVPEAPLLAATSLLFFVVACDLAREEEEDIHEGFLGL